MAKPALAPLPGWGLGWVVELPADGDVPSNAVSPTSPTGLSWSHTRVKMCTSSPVHLHCASSIVDFVTK